MQPAYYRVQSINPHDTSVIVLKAGLEEALGHYRAKCETMPDFLVADWNGGNDVNLISAAQTSGVNIAPLATWQTRKPHNLCLYGRKFNIHCHKGGFSELAALCFQHGITQNYGVDAATLDAIAWKNPARPGYMERRKKDILKVCSAIADNDSLKIFLQAMKSIETGDPAYMAYSTYPEYAHPFVRAQSGDVVLEGGVDTGETTAMFAQEVGPQGFVAAFEPVRRSCELARESLRHLDNVAVENLGLWSDPGIFYIEDKGGCSRIVCAPTDKTEKCKVIDIDSYLTLKNIGCDLIKLDVEGAEMEVMRGAEASIGKYLPKLQISLYHHHDHHLDIALWILDRFPGYHFWIGHHTFWYSSVILYASHPDKTK